MALEDASLSTWIRPRDGTSHIYYPKGAVAGLLLDILIRDATDNEASLDDVMRDLYWRTHKEKFTGFSEAAWWESVRRAGGGESFDDFYARYVDGREPYPWDDVLPLAGLKLVTDTTYQPLVGIYPEYDDRGARVSDLVPDGAAATAGVQAGDYLVRAGPVEIDDESSFDEFRAHFAEKPEGTPYDVVVLRGGEEVTLKLELRISEQIERSLVEDPDASRPGDPDPRKPTPRRLAFRRAAFSPGSRVDLARCAKARMVAGFRLVSAPGFRRANASASRGLTTVLRGVLFEVSS